MGRNLDCLSICPTRDEGMIASNIRPCRAPRPAAQIGLTCPCPVVSAPLASGRVSFHHTGHLSHFAYRAFQFEYITTVPARVLVAVADKMVIA